MVDRRCRALVVLWICSGPMILGPARAMADQPVVSHSDFVDVALSQDGVLHGLVVDTEGSPIAGTTVVVRQQGTVMAQLQSDLEGRFAVPILQGGVYNVSAEGTVHAVRLWVHGTAPPPARFALMLVGRQETLRGQPPGYFTRPAGYRDYPKGSPWIPGQWLMKKLANPWCFSGLTAGGILGVTLMDDDTAS